MDAPASKKLLSVASRDSILLARRVRATAAATIEPMGDRAMASAKREHLVKVVIELHQADIKQGDKAEVTAAAKRALASFAPKAGETDRRECRELGTTRRSATGVMTSVVGAIEGRIVWPCRPSASSIEAVSTSLLHEGYRVVVRERRDCRQSTCSTEAMVEWNQLAELPLGWINPQVCGRHTMKACGSCKSMFLCTAENAAGQAPAVYCQVCDAVLIEWGASKRWIAELVTRGEDAVGARVRGKIQRSE